VCGSGQRADWRSCRYDGLSTLPVDILRLFW
jgi:hypothetical protein